MHRESTTILGWDYNGRNRSCSIYLLPCLKRPRHGIGPSPNPSTAGRAIYYILSTLQACNMIGLLSLVASTTREIQTCPGDKPPACFCPGPDATNDIKPYPGVSCAPELHLCCRARFIDKLSTPPSTVIQHHDVECLDTYLGR
jgi:hypothetical protein